MTVLPANRCFLWWNTRPGYEVELFNPLVLQTIAFSINSLVQPCQASAGPAVLQLTPDHSSACLASRCALISPAPSWRSHCQTLPQWWHDVGWARVSGWTVLSARLSETKKMHSGSGRSWRSQSPTFAKGSGESSRSHARMGDLLYHKVALGHTTPAV